MAGYLGKISAIVTVNTSDIASKVQSGFAAPFDRALRSIETTLRNTNKSVEKSFADIYTSAQKQARAVAAAQMGAVKSFDADGFSKRLQIRDDIAEPVKRLAAEIEKTGGILRGNFEPRLVSLQAESQALFDKMAADASSVATGEITALISKVETLGAAFKSAATDASGWEKLSAIGRGDKGTRGTDLLFAGLGAASKRSEAEVENRAAMAADAKESERRSIAAKFASLGVAGREALGTSQKFATLGSDSRRAVENTQAARDMADQEKRVWAIRDAAESEFQQRQAAAARAIHAEEQAAIAKEQAERKSAADEAMAAEKRVWAIRDAEQDAFRRQQAAVAKAIHDEEQSAIAAEKSARIAAEDAVAKKRAQLLKDNEGLRTNLAQERRVAANVGASSPLPPERLEGAMTILPANYYYNRREAAKAKKAAQTGDVSRMGADKLSLAIQQASFAVDDFFSVTGNFEQRLRAVGNNLSQLGFIIGSTFGLLAVVGVSAITQSVLMVRKFTGATEEAERKEAQLKASVESMNTSLERQRAIVQELAETYKGLGREIVEATATPENAVKAKADNFAADLRAQQQAARAEMFAGTTLGLSSRASIAVLEKKLSEESDAVRRFQISAQIASEKAKEAAGLSTIESAARGVAASTPLAKVRAGSAEARERLGGLASMIEAIRNTPNTNTAKSAALEPLEAAFKGISEQLAIFDMAIKIAGDDAKALGAEGFGVLRSRIEKMQGELAGMGEADAGHLQGRLGAIGREMAAAMSGASTPAEMQRKIAALSQRANDVLSDSAQFVTDEKAAEDSRREAAKAAEVRRRARERGAELLMSPSERLLASFRKDLEDATLAAGGPGGAGVAEFVKAKLAEAAPMVAQMANERAAAISPPYYSALQASDTSTMDGQRELNRLLRGEDASKDKNLDELKTQSDLLRDLIAIAKQNGIIVDL